MNPRFKTVAALLPFVHAWPAYAEPAVLDTVVVTATRQASKTNELLSDTTVITRDEIERTGKQSLAEILATAPGLFVTAGGMPGKEASVFIRGTNTGHALLLVDGVPVTSATLGQAPFDTLSSAEIERIEILRGPASALYGSEAIGGVVQVFTRRGEGAVKPSFFAKYGTHNTWEVGGGISGGSEAVSYALSASRLETDGITATRGPLANPDRDGYQNDSMSGSLQWRPAKGHELGVQVLRSQSDNHHDGNLNFDNLTATDILSWNAYSRNRLVEAWTSTLRFGQSENDSRSWRPGVMDRFVTHSRNLSWQNDIATPIGKWLLAFEEQRQEIDSSSTYVLKERTTRSALAGWSANFGSHRLQANARHDDIGHIGDKNTWSVGYGYQFNEQWRAFASRGTAFKAPSFNDLYFPLTCFFFGCFGGNPNLKPESSRSSEIGAAWESGAHEAKIVYFDNKIIDLIDWGNTPVNVGQARIKGVTATYAGSLGPWRWNAALDLLDPRDVRTDKVLRRRAREQFQAGLDYSAGAWTVGGRWHLVGGRYDDAANTKRMGGYGLLDLVASYRIDKDWSIESQVKNVTDKTYELALGSSNTSFVTAGRTAFVGVRYAPK